MEQKPFATSVIFTIIGLFLAGLIMGIIIFKYFISPDCDCKTKLSNCISNLEDTKDDLKNCLIDVPFVPTSISVDSAFKLMARYDSLYDHSYDTTHFKGLNIHLGHMALLTNYAASNVGSRHHGYRLYVGLGQYTNRPSARDLIHLLFPVSMDGVADTTISQVMVYDPPENFELPCPTFCDITTDDDVPREPDPSDPDKPGDIDG